MKLFEHPDFDQAILATRAHLLDAPEGSHVGIEVSSFRDGFTCQTYRKRGITRRDFRQ